MVLEDATSSEKPLLKATLCWQLPKQYAIGNWGICIQPDNELLSSCSTETLVHYSATWPTQRLNSIWQYDVFICITFHNSTWCFTLIWLVAVQLGSIPVWLVTLVSQLNFGCAQKNWRPFIWGENLAMTLKIWMVKKVSVANLGRTWVSKWKP